MDIGPPLILAQAATSDTFTLGNEHGLVDDDQVWIYQAGAAALPTGVSEDTLYYIISQSSNTCELSLSQGGGAVDITVAGDCIIVGKPETS